MKINAKIDKLINIDGISVKALASVSIDGMFAIHNFRVMDGEHGLFVAMPSVSFKDKDGNNRFSEVFHAVTKDAHDAMQSSVLNAYKCCIDQSHVSEMTIGDVEVSEEASQSMN